MSPQDVRKKTFTPVRWRGGYAMGEVDRLLDLMESSLDLLAERRAALEARRELLSSLAASRAGAGPRVATPVPLVFSDDAVTAEELGELELPQVRRREGYSIEEVDAFLVEMRDSLTELEAEVNDLLESNRRLESELADPSGGV